MISPRFAHLLSAAENYSIALCSRFW